MAPLDLEITGHEPLSEDIAYLPVNIRLTADQVRAMIHPFQITVVDVVLARMPSAHVFHVERQSG